MFGGVTELLAPENQRLKDKQSHFGWQKAYFQRLNTQGMLTNRTHLVKTNKNQQINQKLLTFTNKDIHLTPVQLQPTPPFQKRTIRKRVSTPGPPKQKLTYWDRFKAWHVLEALFTTFFLLEIVVKMRYFGFSPSVREIFVRGDWWAVAQWVEEDFCGRLYFETVQLLRFSCRRRRRRRRRCCCWIVTMFD